MNAAWIGPYRILRTIAEGGMGTVLEAYDESLSRRLAIKLISKAMMGDPVSVARFKLEARTLALLNHPSIVTVYSLGSTGRHPYIAMEYVEGEPLSRLLAGGRPPTDVALSWLCSIARGIGAAHEAGVLHRDLKPSNVLIRPDGLAKIIDFGLAKPCGGEGKGLTAKGLILGTPDYLAPEVRRGCPATVQSEIYSLGAIARAMLTGDLPPELERTLSRMCRRDPEERHRSMAELLSELDRGGARTSTPFPPLSPKPARLTRDRWREDAVSLERALDTALKARAPTSRARARRCFLVMAALLLTLSAAIVSSL